MQQRLLVSRLLHNTSRNNGPQPGLNLNFLAIELLANMLKYGNKTVQDSVLE